MRTLTIFWKHQPKHALAICTCALLLSAAPVAIAWNGKVVIDSIVQSTHATDAIGRNAAAKAAAGAILLELLLVVSAMAAERLMSHLRQMAGMALSDQIRILLVRQAMALDVEQIECATVRDNLARARRDVGTRPVSILMQCLAVFQHCITLAGFAATLWTYNVTALILLITASIPILIADTRFSRKTFQLHNGQSSEIRRLGYIESLLTHERTVKEIKHYRLAEYLTTVVQKLSNDLFKSRMQVGRQRTTWGIVFSTCSTAIFFICYWNVVSNTLNGALSIGEMGLYILAFRQSQQVLNTLSVATVSAWEDKLFLSNLFTFLDLKPCTQTLHARRTPITISPDIAPTLNPPKGICIQDLGFRYNNSTKWAIQNINLDLLPGTSLGIVGENGAGKSTLLKLLLGLYRPTAGGVYLDGKRIHDIEPTVLNRRISVLFQDFNRYNLSLRENVAFGDLQRLHNDSDLLQALKDADSDAILKRPGATLETLLGGLLTGGIELSGGEWQRIGLSRTLLNRNSDILILDEPTAALDPATEHNFHSKLSQRRANLITVVVSHRLSAVRGLDRIVVLKQGQIIESGSHESLLNLGKVYAELYTKQAAGYK